VETKVGIFAASRSVAVDRTPSIRASTASHHKEFARMAKGNNSQKNEKKTMKGKKSAKKGAMKMPTKK
jgi:hypothetical protein